MGHFVPSIGTPVFGVWKRGKIFPRRGVLSHKGVCFPMCRVRCFFCRPGHMLAPSKNFCGDLYPRIMFPHAFSHLLPPTYPMETLEMVCSYIVTLGHQITPGGTWEVSRKSQPPAPIPLPRLPWQSMFSTPGTSQVKHVLLGGPRLPQVADPESLPRGQGRSVHPVLPGHLFSHGSRVHFSEWKHVLACGCVFSHADCPFLSSISLHPQASGPAPNFSPHSRWEETSN